MANIVDAEDFTRKATVIEDGEEKTTEFASLEETPEEVSAEPAEVVEEAHV